MYDFVEKVNYYGISFLFCHSREGGNPEFSGI